MLSLPSRVPRLLLPAFALFAFAPLQAAPSNPDYAALRTARAQSLTSPDGWFSLVALQPLQPGDTTVGSAPGSTLRLPHLPAHLLTLRLGDNTITAVNADPIFRDPTGHAVSPGTVLGPDENPAHAFHSGQVSFWIIERGGQRFLRVKDPEAPERLGFHGLRWYAPDPRYRIAARWVPYTAPHTLLITNKLGQRTAQPVPGYAEFTLDGHPFSLEPTVESGNLFFVFRDTTGRDTTDGGGRFLTVPPPPGGLTAPGPLELDFNRAVNPPCSYSPFATCPLAPARNRLPIAIPAGEKRYND